MFECMLQQPAPWDSSDENTNDEEEPEIVPPGSNMEPHIRHVRPDSHSFNLVDEEDCFPVFQQPAIVVQPAQQTAPGSAVQPVRLPKCCPNSDHFLGLWDALKNAC